MHPFYQTLVWKIFFHENLSFHQKVSFILKYLITNKINKYFKNRNFYSLIYRCWFHINAIKIYWNKYNFGRLTSFIAIIACCQSDQVDNYCTTNNFPFNYNLLFFTTLYYKILPLHFYDWVDELCLQAKFYLLKILTLA